MRERWDRHFGMLFLFVVISFLRLPSPVVADESLRVTSVASGLEHPWGLEFLPDSRMLVTERPGRMRIITPQGELSAPLEGVPEVYAHGQGGLLDVALSPDYATSRLIFFSFAEPGPGGAGTAVARANLEGAALSNVRVIFRQMPKLSGDNHWGSRLVFRNDGTLFVTLGDRYHARDQAQNLANHLGKIVRINPDGSVPKDNPFVGKPDALPEIWSYGHRNVQGAAIHPQTGELWAHEHGARGGDELNIVRAGHNYGWPVITHGIDYSGAPIGIGRFKEGMDQPIRFWIPSIAPCGMLFHSGTGHPPWKGNIFIGALAKTHFMRLSMEGESIAETRYLETLGKRIRDVREGPDGAIYLLVDSSRGEILRVDESGRPSGRPSE